MDRNCLVVGSVVGEEPNCKRCIQNSSLIIVNGKVRCTSDAIPSCYKHLYIEKDTIKASDRAQCLECYSNNWEF